MLLPSWGEVQAPFKLLWTLPGWEWEEHFVIPPHVASTETEVRKCSYHWAVIKVPFFDTILGVGRRGRVPCYSQARVEI